MLDLGSTAFIIETPGLPRKRLERYSTELFDKWDAYILNVLSIPDYSVALEIEEGSIKGKGKIAVALGALYFGIGNYGSFIGGVQTIRDQVVSASNFLADQANSSFDADMTVKRKGGIAAQLHRLFTRVQSGQLSVDEAMIEAERLIGENSTESPDFMGALREALRTAPKHHLQTELGLEAPDVIEPLPENNESEPKSHMPRPPLPPFPHLRIEVWRESRKEERKVRISNRR